MSLLNSIDNSCNMTVDELIIKYQYNPQLLDYILLAKAEEDKRLTAEEWRQIEEILLQTKFIEYELNQNSQQLITPTDNNHCFQDTDTCFLFDDQVLFPQDMFNDMQSSTPLIDSYEQENSMKSTNDNFNKSIIKSKSGRSIVHKTLSYENVMNLEEYNVKIMNEIKVRKQKKRNSLLKSKESASPIPLDHEKVMEALRAKLKRTNNNTAPTPKQSSTINSTPPSSPPNTFPTTGILVFNNNHHHHRIHKGKFSNTTITRKSLTMS